MLVMTTKINKKKIAVILVVLLMAVAAIILLCRGGGEAQTTAAQPITTNDGRVRFLTDYGWEVSASPIESSQVRIPKESGAVFDRYNALQKSQGYDLTPYAGKTVMRYVYQIQNFPGATEPVYATILVYKNQIIGGDITDTSAKGAVRGFEMPKETTPPATRLPAETAPETVPSAT